MNVRMREPNCWPIINTAPNAEVEKRGVFTVPIGGGDGGVSDFEDIDVTVTMTVTVIQGRNIEVRWRKFAGGSSGVKGVAGHVVTLSRGPSCFKGESPTKLSILTGIGF